MAISSLILLCSAFACWSDNALAGPSAEPVTGSGLPADGLSLERSGAIIGRIEIDHNDIFNLDDPEENNAKYR